MRFSGNVARASRWQLVNIDEDSLVGIARIERKHALINIFLETFAVKTRSQSATRGAGERTSFDALSLGVSGPGHFLDNNAPFSIDIHCSNRTAVNDIAGADVSFFTRPVSLLKEFAFVIGVVKMCLCQRS